MSRKKLSENVFGGGSLHKLLAVVCSLALCISFCLPSAQAIAATAAAAQTQAATEQAAQEGADTQEAAAADTQQQAADEAAEAAQEPATTEAASAAEAAQTVEVEQPQANNAAVLAAGDAWDGKTIDTSWYNTTDKEFTISTAAELAGLAAITSPKNDYAAWEAGTHDSKAAGIAQDNFAGKTVKLGADIDLGNKQFDPIADFNNWGGGGQGTSNGTYSEVAWQGTFDGQGHTVSNLSVDGSINCSTNFNGYQGLISAIGKGAVVKTLGVTGWVKARVGGGIVGCSNTDMGSDTSATLTMTRAEWPTIMNCWADVDVDGNGSGSRGCGGIFGGESDYRSAVNIINCYAKGDIDQGTIGSAGGVAGYVNGVVAGCYNLGQASGAYEGAVFSTMFTDKVDEATYRGTGVYSNIMALSGSAANAWRTTDTKNGDATAPEDAKFSTLAEIKAGLSTLGNGFVADEKNVNNGYPALFWQAGQSEIDLSNAEISAIDEQSYTGQAVKPALTVKLGETTLNANADYYVVYEDNIQPGENTAKATVYGVGRYTGQTKTVTFSIKQLDLSKCSVEQPGNTWSYGPEEPATPALTVKDETGEKTLVEGTDYVVEWVDNVEKGVATANIKPASAGTVGSLTTTFNVVRASSSISGTGTEADPYLIGSKGDLQYVAHQTNTDWDGAGSAGANNYAGQWFKVTADFDATAADDTDLAADPLGTYTYDYDTGIWTKQFFSGSIDGDGHTITLGISYLQGGSQGYSGLVAYAGTTDSNSYDTVQTFKNITVEGRVDGRYAGGIAARVYGSTAVFENCVNKATLGNDSADYMTASWGQTGGIAGYVVRATFKNCVNEGTIISPNYGSSDGYGGILGTHYSASASTYQPDTSWQTVSFEDCVNKGTITLKDGSGYVGGILGYDFSYTTTTVKRCANTGNISGGARVGGIVGDSGQQGNSDGYLSVDACYNRGAVSGTATGTSAKAAVGGLLGADNTSSSYSAARTLTLSGYNAGTLTANATTASTPGQFVGTLTLKSKSANITKGWITTCSFSGNYEEGTGASSTVGTTSVTDGSPITEDVAGVIGDTLKALTGTKLGSAFVADSPAPEVNAGYPALYWERGGSQSDLSDATADAIGDQTYTGIALTPAPTGVKVGDAELVAGRDFTLSYADNVNAGTAKAILTGIGLYTGTKELSFTIAPQNVSSATIAEIPAMWAAPSIPAEPTLTVKDARSTTLVLGSDYTVSYADNAATGTATATVNGIGNYTGTNSVVYQVYCTSVDGLSGAGTTADPYTISSKDELEFAALAVNNAKGAWPYGAFKLAADFDATDSDGRLAVDSIGTSANRFASVFDGDGHTITIGNSVFGVVEDAEVSNITTIGAVSFTPASTTDYKGAIAGQAFGTTVIEGCVNKASLTIPAKPLTELGGILGFAADDSNITIKDCTNEGKLKAIRGAGGILARTGNAVTIQIEHCFNNAGIDCTSNTTNTYNISGGILGYADLGDSDGSVAISKCGNTGFVNGSFTAGGILGKAAATSANGTASCTLTDVYNTGKVHGTYSNAYTVAGTGGIVGVASMTATAAGTVVQNAYNAGVVDGQNKAYPGGILGCLDAATKFTATNTYWGETTTDKSVGYTTSEVKLTDESVKKTDDELKTQGTDGMAALLGASFYDDTTTANQGYPVLDHAKAELVIPLIKKQDYTSQAIVPDVTVYNVSTSPKTELVEGTDYVLMVSDNTEVGTASVRAVGIGAYEGSEATSSFQIVACALSKCTVEDVPAQTATGEALEPTLVVKNPAGIELARGVDYDVAFANNVEIGQATYVIVPKTANYTGSLVGSFQIVGKSLDGAEVTVPSAKTTGADQSADIAAGITVKDADGNLLVKDTDYTVSFLDAEGNAVTDVTDKGDYTAVVTGTGNYAGSARATFTVAPFLTVKQNRAGAGEQVLAEYTKAQFEALADISGNVVSGLYGGDGKWKVDTAASYVTVSNLFKDAFAIDNARAADDAAKVNADNMTAAKAYSEKNTTSVAYASGDFGVSKTYSELEGGRFYKNTTQTSKDASSYDDAPAVLSITEASSAIEADKTAADAETANKAAANGTNEPRMVLGMSEDDYTAGSFAGRSFVSGIDTITLSYDEPIVMKVALQFGADSEAGVVKEYSDADFKALSTGKDATPVSGMFYKGDTWHVTSTDNYVKATDLFTDAGVSQYWKSGTGVSFGATKGGSLTYDSINAQRYFFPSAMGGQSLAPDKKVDAPFVFSVTEMSCGLAEDQTAAEGQDQNIANWNVTNYPRSIWGISEEDYTAQGSGTSSSAGGWRYWNQIEQVTLIVNETIEVGDLDTAGYEYTGSAIEPKPVVKVGDTTLEEGTDYSLVYEDNIEPGTGKVTVVFDQDGTYKGQPSVTKEFTIKSGELWERLAGNTAIGTMKSIVNEGWDTSEYAVVATNSGYYDALSASGLAGLLDAPVMLTDSDDLPNATKNLLTAKKVQKVVVVGGTNAVSDRVKGQIEALGISVDRVAGRNAVSTANKVYDYGNTLLKNGTITTGWGKDAIVATGSSFQDALSIAPYSYAKGAPIFLAQGKPGTLADATKSRLAAGGFTRTVIPGGTAAVASSVDKQVANATRLAGNNAYGTSKKIAEFCLSQGMTAAHMGVATGRSYYDALSGAMLCGKNNSILILADDKNSNNVNGVIKPNKAQLKMNCYVFGGPAAVSDTVYKAIEAASK